jgi:hypothetical protein
MNFLAVVVIGAGLGVLDGVGIFFEPSEPYKWQILFAATLKGVLVAILTAFSLTATTRWWSAVGTGALRTSLQSCDLSCKGRSQIGRRAVCDSEWDHHGSIDWFFIVIWAIRTI